MKALATVIGQTANERFGHIAVGIPGGHAQASFVDMGTNPPRLSLWTAESPELDATGARELAAALEKWAQRADERL